MAVDNLQYVTEVKGDVTVEQAVAALHDHQIFFDTDPNLVSVKPTAEPKDGKLHDLPDSVKTRQKGDTKFYEVVDSVPGTLARLVPGASTISTYYQITDLEDGIYVYIQATMGVTQVRRWVVEIEDGSVRLKEYATINCTMILAGVVRGQSNQNWKAVHAGYVKKLGAEVGAQS